MNLAIDVGNTFIKAGVFDKGRLTSFRSNMNEEELIHLFAEIKPEHLIISSVGKSPSSIFELLGPVKKTIFLDSSTNVPLINLYKTPQTLGMDRIAASVGAAFLFPETDRLVIDAGTCITYDFIDYKDQYHGGGISPGIDLRFKALNTFTKKLPLVERNNEVELIGSNTEKSILSGVINGVLCEVDGIISQYKSRYSGIKIIICGGDSSFFESKIKETIFAVPELVIIGLNRILEYNVSKA
jgi:type III pantothenate kinase